MLLSSSTIFYSISLCSYTLLATLLCMSSFLCLFNFSWFSPSLIEWLSCLTVDFLRRKWFSSEWFSSLIMSNEASSSSDCWSWFLCEKLPLLCSYTLNCSSILSPILTSLSLMAILFSFIKDLNLFLIMCSVLLSWRGAFNLLHFLPNTCKTFYRMMMSSSSVQFPLILFLSKWLNHLSLHNFEEMYTFLSVF